MTAGPLQDSAVQLLPGGEAELRSEDAVVPALRASSAPGGQWMASVRAVLIGCASIAIWLGVWELASRYELDFFFRFENIPAPSEVLLALGELLSAPKFV